MGDVIKFKKPRRAHFRGLARDSYTDAIKSVGSPQWVVITAMGKDGTFATRAIYEEGVTHEFDMYARVEALMNKHKQSFIDA